MKKSILAKSKKTCQAYAKSVQLFSCTPKHLHTTTYTKVRTHNTFNVGEILCDKHEGNKTAMHYLTDAGKLSIQFDQLSEYSKKFGNFLRNTTNLQRQDRIAIYLPKCPELLISGLAIWRNGFVYVPLFTAFGYDGVLHRVLDSHAKVIVTDEQHFSKLLPILEELKKHNIKIIVVETDFLLKGKSHHSNNVNTGHSPEYYNFWKDGVMSPVNFGESKDETLSSDENLIFLYTSGTTGKPKAVKVTAKSLIAFETYMRYGLHIEEDDNFLNIADAGWAYGLYYNVIGSNLIGKPVYFVNKPFKPANIYQILQDEEITNFTAAPTAYRAMKAEGDELAKQFRFYVKKASSAGEPLNPEVVKFFNRLVGCNIQSHFGQTEHGMILNYHHHPELKPIEVTEPTTIGSSMPGFKVTLLDDDYKEITEPFKVGHLVIDIENSPARFFDGYWNAPDKTKERFVKSNHDGKVYELTGDMAYKDHLNHYFFSGRSDDVITSSGYRIGPKEIEDCLLEHVSIKESGVVGKPCPLRGEMVVAFVVLRPGFLPSNELKEELKQFVKKKLSAHQYPKEIYFEEHLPTTEGGKIKRNILRDKAKSL
ncbi:hypothetical protein ABK040_006072 [Willaertia magna]